MRLAALVVLISLAAITWAWTKDDYEIFDLVSALEAAEGKSTDFYSHVGVAPSASTSEITKAYRKKSLELHPDKNPGVAGIHDRFARLGIIAQILRSPEGRERYDFFYKNGVPIWRGTGYYYSRFRPTLAHTLAFLMILTSAFHYLVMRMNYAKDRRRVQYFERAAKTAAGVGKDKKGMEGDKENSGERDKGRKGVTMERRRKVRVPMVEGNEYAGTLELIVEGEEVLLPHEDGSPKPLSGLAAPPTIIRTWPFLVVSALLRRAASALPESYRSSLPAHLRPPSTVIAKAEGEEEDALPTRARSHAAALRNDRRSKSSTPRDSPAATDLESDDSAKDGEGENCETGGEAKKKKRGPGKAAAMRRRKAAMKK